MSRPLPKRLIEVDLPIKRISAHARREKSIRHGHIATLHIWWARRPLAACRAVICAALWPDPADENCPLEFRAIAAQLMFAWARENSARGSADSAATWTTIRQHTSAFALCSHPTTIRHALLDFIADFSNWDNSKSAEYLNTAQALTAASHWALSLPDSQRPQELGWPGSDRWEEVLPDLTKQAANGPRPLALDPFAGGGSIPLEFSRVGADAFASDLNPIPVLLNKVILEFIPKYGQRLADEVRRWGKWIEDRARAELQEFYPTGKNGAEPIAYLWARQIRCEGPSCGAEFPLMRSLWLAKRDGSSTALRLVTKATPRELHFEIIENAGVADVGSGTVARSSGTCPFCGFTTPASSVRTQLKPRRGGTHDALLIAVREDDPAGGRTYRLPTDTDRRAASSAAKELGARTGAQVGGLSIVPNEPYPDETGAGALSSSVLFGFKTWGDIFTPRQALALTTFVRLIERASVELSSGDSDLDRAIVTCLAQAVNRTADFCTSLCRLNSTGGRGVVNTFSRQALPMLWDFFETNPFNKVGANWSGSIEACVSTVENELHNKHLGTVERVSATKHLLPDDAAHLFVTDPPYYDAIAYGDLSDFFYVWLKRTVGRLYPALFSNTLVDKTDEVVHLSKRFRGPYAHKTKEYFEDGMQAAMREGRRILHSSGIGVVVFAHKSTSGWESMLQALIDAGWTVTGSWPIDTERGGRMNAIGTAALASSVHIVCRPRESIAAASNLNEVGDWRDILQELPRRIHEWMPRLAQEGVVGADAIFACLGPALEIYSRYARVEKASGEQVLLREYLEHVWAAVSKEALSTIILDADISSFEPDARLTAMWLWTLNAGATTSDGEDGSEDDSNEDEAEDSPNKTSGKSGFILEYDAARKIAQGLGANLDDLDKLIEVKADKARLLPVAERTAHLFGKEQSSAPSQVKQVKKKAKQMDMFGELAGTGTASTEGAWEEKTVSKPGVTVLDRVHQSMILFAAGRGDALKRFLVDDGIGHEANFWKLAQALSALYPASAQEKRWVDGVLARKKGLGL